MLYVQSVCFFYFSLSYELFAIMVYCGYCNFRLILMTIKTTNVLNHILKFNFSPIVYPTFNTLSSNVVKRLKMR